MSEHLTTGPDAPEPPEPESLGRALERWRAAGLITAEAARAIEAHEATGAAVPGQPAAARARGWNAGGLLSYAGVVVSLMATLGLYGALFDGLSGGGRIALTVAASAIALAGATVTSRMRGGAAATDALSFAATVLVFVAAITAFDTAGWFGGRPSEREPGYLRALTELRTTFLVSAVAAALVGWGAARRLGAPIAALPGTAAAVWAVTVVVWWVTNPGGEAPGTVAGLGTVVFAYGVAAAATITRRPAEPLLRFWHELAALGAGNVAAIILAGEHGGTYELMLLPLGLAQGAVALMRGQRLWLVGAAVTLYQYLLLVVLRTFEGAAAALAVVVLLGLATAAAGLWWQRLDRHLRARRDGIVDSR